MRQGHGKIHNLLADDSLEDLVANLFYKGALFCAGEQRGGRSSRSFVDFAARLCARSASAGGVTS